MNIQKVIPKEGFLLHVITEKGELGELDVRQFLDSEAFAPLKNVDEFKKVHNGRYFVEWECGADLSSDTIEARWRKIQENAEQGS